MTDRPKIYFGLCEGGPFNQRHLADARAVFPVAYDKVTGKYQGPMQAPTRISDPNLRFGEYRFEGAGWIWHPIRSASKTASPPEPAC